MKLLHKQRTLGLPTAWTRDYVRQISRLEAEQSEQEESGGEKARAEQH